jgi:uncharacterized protein
MRSCQISEPSALQLQSLCHSPVDISGELNQNRRAFISRSVLAVPALLGSIGSSTPVAAQPSAASGLLARELVGLGKPQQAVLLPLSTGPFATASQALKAGFLAAHQRDGQQKPLLFIEVDDKSNDLFNAVMALQADGINWIAGPLTRAGVNAYIDSGVPPSNILSLNLADPDRNIPSGLITFGLAGELEARQIAAQAFDDVAISEPVRRPLRAITLTSTNSAARRAAAAFIDGWRELGGDSPLPIEIENRPLSEIKNAIEPYQPDAIFLSVNIEQLRAIRPAIERKAGLYSTSQLSLLGQPNVRYSPELDGIKLVDMPYLAIADHPVALAYPKPPQRFNNEMTRLYALGLDAFRLIFDVLPYPQRTVLEGATGRLTINKSLNRIERAATVLQYRNGQLVSFG